MKRLLLGIVVLLTIGIVRPGMCADQKGLDLKGVRILVCSGYWDLLALPVVKNLQRAGAAPPQSITLAPGEVQSVAFAVAVN